MNSRDKGKRGERQWAKFLTENGFEARRGVQFQGGTDSPDVVCEPLKWAHFEVKRTEKFNAYTAMSQASDDAGEKTPIVAHKRNHKDWLIVMRAEDFLKLL